MKWLPLSFIICLLLNACFKPDEKLSPPFTIDKSGITLASAAGAIDSLILSTDLNFTITYNPPSQNWLKIDTRREPGKGLFILTSLEENNTTSSRSVTLTITASDPSIKPIEITITQPPRSAIPGLSVDTATLNLNGTSAASDSFSITANVDWTITSSASWLAATPLNGSGNGNIHVQATSGNFNNAAREATLTITATGNNSVQPVTVTVRQEFAQRFSRVWYKLYGGSMAEVFSVIKHTADGGYILAGSSGSNDFDVSGNHGGYDFWVVKINAAGTIQWQRSIGGTGTDSATSIVETNDGYVVAGYTTSNDGDLTGHQGLADGWVVKLNMSGSLVWQRTLGGAGDDYVNSIARTSDGGYLVAGKTGSTNGDIVASYGGVDVWICRLDANGNKLWSKTFGGSGTDAALSMIATSDNHFLIAATTNSHDGMVPVDDTNIWVLKLNANGSLIWQHLIRREEFILEPMAFLTEIPAGGYLVVGDLGSSRMLTKLATNGGEVWSKSLGVSLSAGKFHAVIPSGNGGFLLAGYGTNQNNEMSGRLTTIDEQGRFVASLQFGGLRKDVFFSIAPAEVGHFVAAGVSLSGNEDGTFSHGQTFEDGWLMKVKVNY